MLHNSIRNTLRNALTLTKQCTSLGSVAVLSGIIAGASLGTTCEGPELVSDEHNLRSKHYYMAPSSTSRIKIFSGHGNPALANEIALHLGTQLGRMTVKPYADGETSVKLHDNVRGKRVYIVQPTCPPVNENVMELLLMATTMRRASAKEITAIIPYFGYGRSTETFSFSRPIAGADVAIMLEVCGVDRIVAVDLHRSQIQGFFSPVVPVDNLDASPIALPYFQTKYLNKPVVVAPDANGTARAKSFCDKMNDYGFDASFAMMVDSKCETDDEQYFAPGTIKSAKHDRVYHLVGDVSGRDVIIVDDIIDSGSRMQRTAKMLRSKGAKRIFAFASHGLFTGDATENLSQSPLLEVVVLNTVPLRGDFSCEKVQQLSIGALLAETITRIHRKEGVTELL